MYPDKQYLAILFVGIILVMTLILYYFNPLQLFEFVITTAIGAIVALAVPLGRGNNDPS